MCGRVEKWIQNFGYKPEWKRQLGTVRCRWKDMLKMDIKGKGWDDADWIHLFLYMDL
jgi:hypothetical protein